MRLLACFADERYRFITSGQMRRLLTAWGCDHVSEAAEDLLCGLLCANPRQRYTIEQVLKHPWLRDEMAARAKWSTSVAAAAASSSSATAGAAPATAGAAFSVEQLSKATPARFEAFATAAEVKRDHNAQSQARFDREESGDSVVELSCSPVEHEAIVGPSAMEISNSMNMSVSRDNSPHQQQRSISRSSSSGSLDGADRDFEMSTEEVRSSAALFGAPIFAFTAS